MSVLEARVIFSLGCELAVMAWVVCVSCIIIDKAAVGSSAFAASAEASGALQDVLVMGTVGNCVGQ